jgi:hypothetical protein
LAAPTAIFSLVAHGKVGASKSARSKNHLKLLIQEHDRDELEDSLLLKRWSSRLPLAMNS